MSASKFTVTWTHEDHTFDAEFDKVSRTTEKIRDLLNDGITDITVTQTTVPAPLRFEMVVATQPSDVEHGEFPNDTVFNADQTRATAIVQFDGASWTFLNGDPTSLPAVPFDPKTWAELTASTDDGGYGLVSLTMIQD